MARVPIVMPQLGESVAEATVVRYSVEPGAQVAADQEIIEVETNKAVMSVVSPCSGVVETFVPGIGEVCEIGSVLGYITSETEVVATPGSPLDPKPAPPVAPAKRSISNGIAAPDHGGHGRYFSPRVQARLDDLGWRPGEVEIIPGSGAGGRLTSADLEKYVDSLQQHPLQKASPMRQNIADSMRRSWSRPIATIGIELSMEPIFRHRKALTDAPGPALYLAKALAAVIAAEPGFAARLMGDQLVMPRSIDIGVAVEVEDGVVVAVMRELDQRPFAGLGKYYQELVRAARARKLPPEARGNSIATVTNFGPLGITWATPIPQPDETLILGLGKAERKPVWSDPQQTFLPQLKAELNISFDHRVIDGGASGRLAQRIIRLLEEPENI